MTMPASPSDGGGSQESGGSAPAAPSPAAPAAPAAPAQPQTGSWKDALSADLRNHPSLADTHSLEDLAKTYVHSQSLLGRERLPKPDESWTPEQWNKLYAELGVPDSVEGYSSLDSMEMPNIEGVKEVLEQFKPAFKYANLTPAQAEIMSKAYANWAAGQQERVQEAAGHALEATMGELKREWGNAYDAKLEQANEAAQAIFGDQLDAFRSIRLADGSFLGDSNLMVRLLAAVGDSMGEGSLHTGGSRATMTPHEAEAELRALESDPEARAAWLNRDHPRHKEIIQRRTQLRQMATPDNQSKRLFDPQF